MPKPIRSIFILATAIALAGLLGVPAEAQSQRDRQPPVEPYYVLVLTSPNWQQHPNEVAAVRMVKQVPNGSPLQKWTSRAVVKHMTIDDPVYQARIARAVPPVAKDGQSALPIVIVMHRDGRTFYKASRENVPKSSYQLGREIDYYYGFGAKHKVNGESTVSFSDSRDQHGPIDFGIQDDLGAFSGDRCPGPDCRVPDCVGPECDNNWRPDDSGSERWRPFRGDGLFPDSVELEVNPQFNVPVWGWIVGGVLVFAFIVFIVVCSGGLLAVLAAIGAAIWPRKDP